MAWSPSPVAEPDDSIVAVLVLALAAQLLVHADTDSVYATPALRQLVARAASVNAMVPAALRRFDAEVETEISFVIRDTLGREHSTQIEQMASAASWTRSGYELHVHGFRSQSIGLPFSALSFVRGWTVPMLYGNRLQLGLDGPRERTGILVLGRGQRRDTVRAVHPFAADRDGYYRYSGGNVVATLHTATRTVPVMRIIVTPANRPRARIAAFQGEIDIDADSGDVVRLRGRVVYPDLGQRGGWRGLSARVSGFVSAAFVEFVNENIDGRYWLPEYQRTEIEAGASMFGPERSILRIVSSFSGYRLDTATVAKADAATPAPPRVTFAPADSLNRFDGWHAPLGAASGRVAGSDFDELSPNVWRPGGGPVLRPYPRRFGDVLRFNRVEGAYTGIAGDLRFRDAAPGLSANGWAGWAWAEHTARGGGSMMWSRFPWSIGGRAERDLATTNDFRPALEGGSSLAALFGSLDAADYVDRRIATATIVRDAGGSDRFVTDLELGVAEDQPEIARLQHGLFTTATSFRPNRFALPGRYARAVTDLEYHPNVSGDFLQPGAGARLHVEYAHGQLDWMRTELSLAARQYWNDVWFAARASGGIVTGAAMPPQALFEIGGTEGLPGYAYKQFGGDRAALSRVAAGFTFPVLRSPRRVFRGYFIPGISPGFAVGIQGGWADASSAAAWRALSMLSSGSDSLPRSSLLSVPTGRVRATADLRLTFFSGAVSVGVARPVDHASGWSMIFALGQAY